MDKIKILVVSERDWKTEYTVPEWVKLYSYKTDEIRKKDIFEITVIEKNITEQDFDDIKAHSYSYCLFVTDDLQMDATTKRLFEQRMGKTLPREHIQFFIDNEAKKYFSEPYGEKFNPKAIGIAQSFKGSIKWDGNTSTKRG